MSDVLTEDDKEIMDRCAGNLPSMVEVEMLLAIIDRLCAEVSRLRTELAEARAWIDATNPWRPAKEEAK